LGLADRRKSQVPLPEGKSPLQPMEPFKEVEVEVKSK